MPELLAVAEKSIPVPAVENTRFPFAIWTLPPEVMRSRSTGLLSLVFFVLNNNEPEPPVPLSEERTPIDAELYNVVLSDKVDENKMELLALVPLYVSLNSIG